MLLKVDDVLGSRERKFRRNFARIRFAISIGSIPQLRQNASPYSIAAARFGEIRPGGAFGRLDSVLETKILEPAVGSSHEALPLANFYEEILAPGIQ